MGTGIKMLHITTTGKNDIIVPFAGTGIKAYVIKNSFNKKNKDSPSSTSVGRGGII